MREQILNDILASGAVAVIRMSDAQKLLRVIDAIREGGITAIEVTMTTPNALQVIEQVARTMGDDVQIGVGSVLSADVARQAIGAGARYVVSPIFKPEIVEETHRHGLPAMPGAFTPTEIQAAHEAGADVVKVFPADVVGMAYFKAVLAPMPHLKMMPTGGVTLDNAGDWLRAGAVAVGVGGALLDKHAIDAGRYDVLTEHARRLRRSIEGGRR
jgi:2-dehydro-3-deoxyphosphogluconate aldolase/(4S)-4-hydroxy-2-oxoglutarate aldolase